MIIQTDNEKQVTYIEGEYEDKLYIGNEYLGRVDTLTLTELLCLLAQKGVIDLLLTSK